MKTNGFEQNTLHLRNDITFHDFVKRVVFSLFLFLFVNQKVRKY